MGKQKMANLKKKKVGRPSLPKGEVKRTKTIRLSDKQLETVYYDLDESLSLQAALDFMIYQYGAFITQDA